MGTHVWVFFVCGLTLILIVFTVILERLISLLCATAASPQRGNPLPRSRRRNSEPPPRRAARCRHDIPDSYQPIVHKVQEEFMLMGAVSFIVVLVEGITPISVRPDAACSHRAATQHR